MDDWTRLERFLILGAEGGTYYIAEREVTRKVRGEDRVVKYGAVGTLPKLIEAFEQAKIRWRSS